MWRSLGLNLLLLERNGVEISFFSELTSSPPSLRISESPNLSPSICGYRGSHATTFTLSQWLAPLLAMGGTRDCGAATCAVIVFHSQHIQRMFLIDLLAPIRPRWIYFC